ncbi:L,D-transpeptidase [Streptomyces sp. NPDC059193]|uniref:L,D-transpeptidase n=1 Tax=Streptomyces sp. NPDC059193 TaxID=3346763 RepID=UPI0036A47949
MGARSIAEALGRPRWPSAASSYTALEDLANAVGRDQQLVTDLDTHTLVVKRDGQEVKSIPMSGGQPVPGRASRRARTFAIKTREEKVHLTSASVGGPKAYDVWVTWGMRFGDSGGYLHQGTDDSQQDIGNTNHSAGCVGMTPKEPSGSSRTRCSATSSR